MFIVQEGECDLTMKPRILNRKFRAMILTDKVVSLIQKVSQSIHKTII